jgi:hypothetical protein
MNIKAEMHAYTNPHDLYVCMHVYNKPHINAPSKLNTHTV